jgi:hypothetical protein
MKYPVYKGTGKRVVPEEQELLPREVRMPFERMRVYTPTAEDGRTQQSFAEDCDINSIIRRFDRDGVLPTGKGLGMYGDVSELNDDLVNLINYSKETLSIADQFLKEQSAKAAKEKAAKEKEVADSKPVVNTDSPATTEAE